MSTPHSLTSPAVSDRIIWPRQLHCYVNNAQPAIRMKGRTTTSSYTAASLHKMANPAKARKPLSQEPRSQATETSGQTYQIKDSTNQLRSTPNRIRSIPPVPITILQDLVSVYHLLSLDPSAPTIAAEKAALETFCSFIWGCQIWQEHLSLARRYFGRPELLLAEDVEIARSAKHGKDCVYRRKGLLLFHETVDTVNVIDAELGSILESCRGDWMVRFRSCGDGVE